MAANGGSTRAHILAVDDDAPVRDLIATYLGDNELRVTAVPGEAEMSSVMDKEAVDLIVLDLHLKGEDGMTIARDLRSTSRLPIIILTGRKDEADRVMGLELGADDYMTKPFSPRELLARIRALLRRTRVHQDLATTGLAAMVTNIRAYRFQGWELNLRLRSLISPSGSPVPLRNGEFNLLLAFLSVPQKLLTRDELLNLSRLHNSEVFDRSIDVLVGRLRRKIESNPKMPQIILTERSAGYLFKAPVDVVRD